MNTSRLPASTPGIDSGRITLVKLRLFDEYRSFDASISRGSIFSRLTYSGRIMKMIQL